MKKTAALVAVFALVAASKGKFLNFFKGSSDAFNDNNMRELNRMRRRAEFKKGRRQRPPGRR